jgi:hypothetical protein
MSPISSRNRVPPSAIITFPCIPLVLAPVKGPLDSRRALSISDSGIAAQLSGTNGLLALGRPDEARVQIALCRSRFPVQDQGKIDVNQPGRALDCAFQLRIASRRIFPGGSRPAWTNRDFAQEQGQVCGPEGTRVPIGRSHLGGFFGTSISYFGQ